MNIRPSKAFAVAAALLFLAAAGCTDPTVAPKSTVTEANIFTDQNSYRAFLAKLYAGLAVTGQQGPHGNADITANDEGFYNYVRLLWCLNELPTDEAVIGWGDPGLPDLNRGTWSTSSPWLEAMYYRVFYQVTLANEFLRQTTADKLASRGVGTTLGATIQQYRAEARFLRALSYWHGIDLFGNIPLVTEDDPVGATPPAQATRAEIYDYIVTELTALRDSLAPAGAGMYGRAARPAADMLLAKVYLNAGVYTGTPQWSGALTAAQAVIASGAYSLEPVYQHNFLADNNTSPEIILPVTSDGQHTQTWGGTTFLVHASCGGSMSPATYGIDYCWWGLRLKPEAYNNYAAGDGRASYFYTSGQNVAVTSTTNWNDGIAAPKFQNVTSTGASGSNGTHPDTDFPLFRLADAYLIYAEANLRGGGGSAATALTYVNALRQRAYGTGLGIITAGQLTLDFVLAERGRELLWEGHRRTDLVRFALFTGGTYLWAWKGGTQAGTALAAHLNLYPLPASELVANPNLTQNTGY
jgi:hypothetical protein